MRLVIELKSTQDNKFETQYNAHIQGFIYNLLLNTPFSEIHDTHGPKPFGFSNIFPFHDLKKDDVRTFIISSPEDRLIRYLFNVLKINSDRQVNIGYMTFKINYLKEVYSKLPEKCTLITSTPITIRIPETKYKEYGYETAYKNFTYWRSDQPLDVFLDQLKMKLVCKYAKYHTQTLPEYYECIEKYKNVKLFDTFRFRKQVANKVLIDGYESVVLGTCWEFGINHLNGNRELLQFAYDSGLGERNSLGFGFMNLKVNN